jgi:UDP-N-acetylglucosamine--N-acetylmuramyl-(pentapeptide) pyrophosphoryl-undecaprenol N-acetylglucosamine transferase
MDKEIKILLSGGGSGGPVTPLLAVARELYARNNQTDFIFVGTHSGPEKILVTEASATLPIRFVPILSGKLRRYFSLKNFSDLFNIGGAFFQSLLILKTEKPNLVMSAGAFVSVPLVVAAKLLKIPILIHQQDVRPGLANRLMAPYANKISVTFEDSLKVYGAKSVLTGNPYSIPQLPSRTEVFQEYSLDENRPLILIYGGGTGATAINEVVRDNLSELLKLTQIIHLSGRGKMIASKQSGYCPFEFLEYAKLLAVMSASDLVISRAGLGSITDLSALHKTGILVPMPHTHQEDNARACENKQAAIFLNQRDLDAKLIKTIKELLDSETQRELLADNIARMIKPGAASAIADLALSLVK